MTDNVDCDHQYKKHVNTTCFNKWHYMPEWRAIYFERGQCEQMQRRVRRRHVCCIAIYTTHKKLRTSMKKWVVISSAYKKTFFFHWNKNASHSWWTVCGCCWVCIPLPRDSLTVCCVMTNKCKMSTYKNLNLNALLMHNTKVRWKTAWCSNCPCVWNVVTFVAS